eukprot:scaffold62814_cov35-Phaeocystis_antarctica.AAC.2
MEGSPRARRLTSSTEAHLEHGGEGALRERGAIAGHAERLVRVRATQSASASASAAVLSSALLTNAGRSFSPPGTYSSSYLVRVRVRARARARLRARVRYPSSYICSHSCCCAPPPEWSKAVESAALEAASSSTQGSGWAPRGPTPRPGCLEPPGAGRCALRRRRSRARALPRGSL